MTNKKTQVFIGPDLCLKVALHFESGCLKNITLSPNVEGMVCEIDQSDLNISDSIVDALQEYHDRRKISLPSLPLTSLSPFTQRTLVEMARIPWGDVLSYGELAAKIGNPRAARAVGNVCRNNPFPLFIPCHRVIASGGKLGGFAYSTALKKLLLHHESQ